ncbi:MAG: hypothetical protein F4138_06945 [Acidimicrobiia bacterium]|nr:hypothetical protein [Acidimicrobiia bacterium]
MTKRDQPSSKPAGSEKRGFDAGYTPEAKIGTENVPSGLFQPPPEPSQTPSLGESSGSNDE